MQNNPITTMLDEHSLISSSEEIIQTLKNKWTSDPENYQETVLDLLVFFREYADGVHHRKEEEVLFPAIRNHPDFVLQDIIDELESHHADFREYAALIKDFVNEKDYEMSYKILCKYVDELLDHIAIENDELFVMAENLMDEGQLEEIYFNFKDIDMEVGEDVVNDLKGKIQKLSQMTS
jgi:hemerythrin-like domain-containing protein